MDTVPFKSVRRKKFSAIHVGKWNDLDKCTFEDPRLPSRSHGKLFLKDSLGLTGMEVSLNKLLPGDQMPFYHRHKHNEELYLFIKGEGQFQIDGEIVDVREGTVIRVAPDAVRTWRNNSTEDLYFIVIQARAGSMPGADISDGIGVKEQVKWPDID